MQAEEDVARAKEAEAAFHARLNAAREDLEHPNPYVRHGAAYTISQMTCIPTDARRFPDDHRWLGNWQERRSPELDKYLKRCRSLWHNEVVKPWRASMNAN
jgi:hypothetical protein